MTDAEMEKFGIEPVTEMDMEAIQAELEAEFAAEFEALSKKNHSGQARRLLPRRAQCRRCVDFGGAPRRVGVACCTTRPLCPGRGGARAPFIWRVPLRKCHGGHAPITQWSSSTPARPVGKTPWRSSSVGRLLAPRFMDGHDIASAYPQEYDSQPGIELEVCGPHRRRTFKFSEGTKATGFTDIAKSMGCLQGLPRGGEQDAQRLFAVGLCASRTARRFLPR